MGEERFNNIAVMYCNRDLTNEVLKHDVEKIIDAFGKTPARSKHLIAKSFLN